mgnify:FL=1
MAALTWDGTGTRFYEMGTKKGVLYPYNTAQTKYGTGVAWNGLTAVTESPSGAEATDLWADDIKYGSMRSAENYGFTIEAYTYPDEFGPCDGSAEASAGVFICQKPRTMFGFSWVTTQGNDVNPNNAGYKLHLVWGATASPSEKAYTTINDSPDAITFSWECETNPVTVSGHNPTAVMTIDSLKADPTDLAALEAKLYGDESNEPTLPTPDEVIAIFRQE